MIPWMREKFAERRARWIASRKRNENNTENLDKTNLNETITVKTKNSHQSTIDVIQHENCSDFNTQKGNITIRLISPIGTSFNSEFSRDTKGIDVKLEAVRLLSKDLNLLSSDENSVLEQSKKYKLIKARIQYVFDEEVTLEDAQIVDDDEFLLIASNDTHVCESNNTKGPSQADIDIATNGLPLKKATPPIVNLDDLVLQSDVQYDIRQILISLAQSAAYIIGSGPYAKRLIEMFKQRLISKKRHDADSLQNLIDMGFSKASAMHALSVTKNFYSAALDWLIENQNFVGLTSSDLSPTTSCLSTNFSSVNSTKENIEALLEIIRIYCRRDIPPSLDMVELIKEMGFEEDDVREALKITKNNHAAACEWLIGNRTKSSITNGLPLDSPILKALLISPHVQLSLSNPKMFIAYLSILDDYSSMSMWLGDSETAGFIGHILRTYHEEKHILAINQFSLIM